MVRLNSSDSGRVFLGSFLARSMFMDTPIRRADLPEALKCGRPREEIQRILPSGRTIRYSTRWLFRMQDLLHG